MSALFFSAHFVRKMYYNIIKRCQDFGSTKCGEIHRHQGAGNLLNFPDRSFQNMFKKLDFQKKIFISFSLIILLILFSSAYIFVNYNTSLLKENVETSSMDSLISIQNQLDDDLMGMDQMLKAAHASSDFKDLAFSIPESPLNYFSQHAFETDTAHSILVSYLTTRDKYSTFVYVSQYYDALRISNSSYRTNILSKESISALPQVKEGLTTSQYQLYYPPHIDAWSTQDYVYSVVRPIRDTFHTYGILEYQKSVSDLDKLVENAAITDIRQFSIIGENTYTYYQYDSSSDYYTSVPGLMQKITSSDKGMYYLDDTTLLCFVRSPLTGWILAIERDIDPLLSNIRQFAFIIFISYFMALCLLLLFLYIMTRNLTRPLRALKDDLSVLEMDQDIQLPKSSGNDEVTILTVAIEETLNKLRLQNSQLINTRKRALQAHFEAMEAQLNPHFLYNTLSVIGACGMETGSRTVPKMCTELSNLLRYSISYTHKNVFLKNELENVKSYLFIMKIRYEHMLDYSWDIDESVLDIQVPKLILQPIIENCFQHGFADTAPVWRIHIRLGQKDGNWYAAVTNNGTPFAETKIKQLKERLQYFKEHVEESSDTEFSKEKMGFGLENTVLRLYIYYQGRETFQIYETEGKETTVEIGGPLK